MMSLHEIIGFSLGGAIISTMALGIFLSAFMPLDRWSKRYFITLFSLMLPCSVICFLALVFWYNPSMAVASKYIYLLEGVFIVTPVFMPTLFLLHYSGEKIKNSPLFWLVKADDNTAQERRYIGESNDTENGQITLYQTNQIFAAELPLIYAQNFFKEGMSCLNYSSRT